MAMSGQFRKTPRLVLYGIAFRVLCGLAVQAGDGDSMAAPRRQEVRQAPGQAQRQPHTSVRANPDAGR